MPLILQTGVADGDRRLGCSIHGIAQGQGVTLSALDGTLAGYKDQPGSRAAPCLHIGISLIECQRRGNLVAGACAFAIHIAACGRSTEG